MTKRLLLITSLIFTVCSLNAAVVSKQKAIETATRIFAERTEMTDRHVSEAKSVSYEGMTAYYIIQFQEGGWVLISADDMSSPLIGYSDKGVFDTENQPENMQGMMEVYCQQIKRNAQDNGVAHAEWESRPASSHLTRAGSDKIAPLIKVKWNQTGAYQKYCPKDANGTAVVGCVAVGMAQAMSVAQYPPRPYGSHSYNSSTYGNLYIDYDKEPDYNWSNILSGANNRDDVARLLYHCGVALNMDYGVSGSGTQTSYIPGALKRNFGYPESVQYYSRGNYQGNWQELILTELQEGRAVAYSGHDPVKNYGHCFNLDGYDGTFFHVNWGWGGSNDGYFGLDGLRDNTMDMDYTSGQGVVIGIRAPSEKPSNIILSNNYVLADQPAGTVVGSVKVESEATDPTFSFIIEGEYSALFHKRLPAPFKIDDEYQLVTTEELSEEDYPDGINIEITATNIENKASVTRHFTIFVTTSTGVSNRAQSYRQVLSETYYSLSGAQAANPAKGLYILRRTYSDGTVETVKVVNP